jgi:hypothetical protein
MAMHKLFLIIVCFGISQLALGQKKTNNEEPVPILKLENRTWVVESKKIDQSDFLAIKLIGQNGVIRGKYTALTDSTLQINDTIIAFNDIENIRVTDQIGFGLGTIPVIVGAAISSYGIFLLSSIGENEGLGVDVIVLVGGTIVLCTGAGTVLVGTIIMSSTSRKFKTKKWKLFVSYPE